MIEFYQTIWAMSIVFSKVKWFLFNENVMLLRITIDKHIFSFLDNTFKYLPYAKKNLESNLSFKPRLLESKFMDTAPIFQSIFFI